MTVTTIKKLRDEVENYSADCVDTSNVPLRSLNFGEKDAMVFNCETPGVAMAGIYNDWAFSQICERLNVPARWVGNPDNCPEALKIKILNELSATYRDNKNFFVRMKGSVIRAVLSDQYSQFDNGEFLNLVGEAVSTMGIEPKIHRASVGDEMRAYMVFPQITFAPDPQAKSHRNGDNGGLHPALYISNSERGGGAARTVGAVFRGICSNGLIYGWTAQETFEVRHRFHSKAMMGVLVAEGVSMALKMSEEATKKFLASQDVKVTPVKLGSIVNAWAEKYGITVEAKDNWMSAIQTEAIVNGRFDDVRLFDVINAATYVSQTRREGETELIERMAGDMLHGQGNLH